MKRILKTVALAWTLTPCLAFATTWYVDGTNGSDDNTGTSQDKAKATIKAAIDISVDNDTILVAPGTYEPIDAHNKKITIKSISGLHDTIIDGGGTNRCAQLWYDESWEYGSPIPITATLEGFTLTNGYGEFSAGVEGGTVVNCLITGNYGWDDAGGGGMARFYDCLIVSNRSSNFGGGGSGAGLRYCEAVNCTIAHNISEGGGGAISHKSKLTNCIIAENVNGDGVEDNIYMPDVHAGNILFTNCYTNIPHFVDAENGDYRLAAGSPCIDMGDNAYATSDVDLDGSERIVNGKVDIGCYEYGSVGGPYVEKVGETNWTYMIKNGKASVGDGSSAAIDTTIAGAVYVPTALRTRPVVAIDKNALKGCTNMTSVTIPASVKTIGDSAFEGCGKLADVYFEGETLSSIGVDAFRGCFWDLIMHVPTTWQGRGRTICGCSIWKGGDPNEVVRVVSTNVVLHYMTTNVPVEVVAPISQDTGIVNVMTEVMGGNVAIPDSWAKGFPTFETLYGSNFTDALTKPTGKCDCNNTPMQVWQDYVAGTDPTNPDDTFSATITMVEGVPHVAWKPVLAEEAAAKRVYRKFGKVKLADEWAEIPTGHEADYNFFKVTVEMK